MTQINGELAGARQYEHEPLKGAVDESQVCCAYSRIYIPRRTASYGAVVRPELAFGYRDHCPGSRDDFCYRERENSRKAGGYDRQLVKSSQRAFRDDQAFEQIGVPEDALRTHRIQDKVVKAARASRGLYVPELPVAQRLMEIGGLAARSRAAEGRFGSLLAARRLLRGQTAIDDETGAGHEPGVVRGEEDDPLGDVLRPAEAADRMV